MADSPRTNDPSPMENLPRDRCGYRLELGVHDTDDGADPCPRPTWDDHGRCVWHAEVDGKTERQLREGTPGPWTELDGAYLREASLVGVDRLAEASLVGADLSRARLNGSDLSGANLTLATLDGVSAIDADFSDATLEGAMLSDADLRRATFEGAGLFDALLDGVHVGGGTTMGATSVYDSENVRPTLTDADPLEAAAWVYRQLQTLYHDNAQPDLSQRSYYLERDARRRLAWKRRDVSKAVKLELSRWVMRYGGSPYRVLVASLFVILAAAVLYPLTGGIRETQGERAITYSLENPEDASQWWLGQVFFKSLYFSVVTFATLGYGDIQPIGSFARMLAGVEALLGALLSALLVFVLTRLVTW